MNPYLLAVLTALGFGFMLIPWGIALRRISSGEFFLVLGVTFLLIGLIQYFFEGGRGYDTRSLQFAILASLLYSGAITAFNYSVRNPDAKLGIIAAISATYPVVTSILEAAIFNKYPTVTQGTLMLVVVAGVVLLSLIGI
ncbi:MAG: EamA family transporter [Acidobacteria bacterium]|nr:EamA family transporter [Acidobacteriota bacterium]